MKNKNSIIALVAGLLSGGLAFFLLYQKAAEIENKTTPVKVLIATRYIPPGNFLQPGMAEQKTVPEAFVSPSAIHDTREVEGLLNQVPISAGEQILSNKFTPGDNSLSQTLSPGYRAYTIEVSESSGVGNLLRPGNRVDLLIRTESNRKETTACAFQDLQVLAVGQKTEWKKQSKTNPTSAASDESENVPGYGTVTLALTPEQAEELMFLDGKPLRLVLRAPNDHELVSIAPQSEGEVLAKLGRFTMPKSMKNIEIIRGNPNEGGR